MMSGRGKLITGPILILIGILLLVGHSIRWQAFSLLWLFVLFAVGVGLLAWFSRGRREAAILSAGVLITLLALHFFMLRIGWVGFKSSWPFFLLSPGLALLSVAASDRQNKDALGPAITLISISVVCYLFTLGILAGFVKLVLSILRFLVRYLLPLGLIAWGGLMLVERRGEKAPPPEFAPEPVPAAPVETVRTSEMGGVEEADEFEEVEEAEVIDDADIAEDDEEAGPRFS
jgi:hypothetical protein